MKKRGFLSGLFGVGRAAKGAASFAAGAAFALALGAVAATSTTSTSATSSDCALSDAAQQAVNDRIKLIGMTSPDPGKYFNAGSPDSCLGNMSIANLDLSKLIPDPLGLFSQGVDSVINSLEKSALAAGCAAVRGSIGDTINKYNYAIGQTNGTLNVNGQVNQYIDTSIADTSKQVLDGYAMNWKTPDTTQALQVSGVPVTVPAAAASTTAATTAASTAATTSTSSGSTSLGAVLFK